MERKKMALGIINNNNNEKKKKKLPSMNFKKNKKRFVKKIVGYLLTDSHMFAPLIFPSPTNFPASKTPSFSSFPVEMKENSNGSNKKLVEKIGDYLMSDCYMYSPIFASQPVSPSKGFNLREKRVAMKVTTERLCRKLNELTVKPSNVPMADKFTNINNPERNSSSDQQKVEKREAVKHVIHLNASVTEKRRLRPKMRKVPVR